MLQNSLFFIVIAFGFHVELEFTNKERFFVLEVNEEVFVSCLETVLDSDDLELWVLFYVVVHFDYLAPCTLAFCPKHVHNPESY